MSLPTDRKYTESHEWVKAEGDVFVIGITDNAQNQLGDIVFVGDVNVAPTLGVSVGFARLPVGVKPGDAAQVDIRGKWVPAQVCKMPFVRNGKAVEHA